MNSKPVIVQAVRNYGVGHGVGGVVENLDREFKALGFETQVVTLENCGPKRSLTQRGFIRSKLLLMRDVVWFSTLGTRAVSKIARKPNTVVVTHGDPVAGHVYVNHGILKKVMRDRGTTWMKPPINPMHWFTLARDEIRYGSRRHKVVVSLTTEDDQILREMYPRLRPIQRVITNGIDLKKYVVVSDESRRALRTKMNLRPEDHVTLFVGHEFERKGLWPTLEALTDLPTSNRLLVVGGDRALIMEAQKRAVDLGVSTRVDFVGRQPDPKDFYGMADSFVLATKYEAAPLVLLEALASGLPVVVTPTGLAHGLVSPNAGNGIIIENDRPATVAAGLIWASNLYENQTRREISSSCRRSTRPYSWRRIAEQYVDLVYEVATGKV